MFTKGFLAEHPLSVEYINAYFKQKIMKSFEDTNVPEEHREMMLSVSLNDDTLVESLNNNPGLMLEVFDKQNIYFLVTAYRDLDVVSFSVISVLSGDSLKYSEEFSTRKEAELFAVKLAFKELEKQLSAQKELS